MTTHTGRTSTRFTEVMKVSFFIAVFFAVVAYAIKNDEGGEFISVSTPSTAPTTTVDGN